MGMHDGHQAISNIQIRRDEELNRAGVIPERDSDEKDMNGKELTPGQADQQQYADEQDDTGDADNVGQIDEEQEDDGDKEFWKDLIDFCESHKLSMRRGKRLISDINYTNQLVQLTTKN